MSAVTDYFEKNLVVISDALFVRLDAAVFNENLYMEFYTRCLEAGFFKVADMSGLPKAIAAAAGNEPYRREVKSDGELWTGLALNPKKLAQMKETCAGLGLRFIEPKLGCAGYIPGVADIFKNKETANILSAEGFPTDAEFARSINFSKPSMKQSVMCSLTSGIPHRF